MNRFAGQVDLTSYLDESPEWDVTTRALADSRQAKQLNSITAESDTFNQGIASLAKLRAAEYGIEADTAASKARASSTVSNAFTDAISGIASSGISAYGKANNLGKYARDEDDE